MTTGTDLAVAVDAEEATLLEHAPLAVRSDVMLPVTPEQARASMLAYVKLVEAVVTEADYQTFRERGKVRRFKKKSAVKKLQTFFQFSIEVKLVQRFELGEGHFGFVVTARATSPNGRFVDATAGCSTHEERFAVEQKDEVWDEDLRQYVPGQESEAAYEKRARKAVARAFHDVVATAETRATNRAAMNLIGAGETTAEEMNRLPAERASSGPAPARNEPPRDAQTGERTTTTTGASRDPQQRQKDALARLIFNRCSALGLKDADRHLIQRIHGIDSMSDLASVTVDQLKALSADLEQRLGKPAS